MPEYIEREAAIQAASIWNGDESTEAWIKSALKKLPAADVRHVVHGKWIKPTRVPDSMLSECSVCGFDTGAYTFNFCPNCGARMECADE